MAVSSLHRYLQQEAVAKRRREEWLLQKEEEVKQRVAAHVKDRRKEIADREELLKQREKLLMERLHRGFRKAESQLIAALEDRKGEVKVSGLFFVLILFLFIIFFLLSCFLTNHHFCSQ
jgi:hypothetical protein